MTAENTPGAVSYPDDYAAFEAAMQPAGKTDTAAAAVEENTSEDSKESESAGESETPKDTEQSGDEKPGDKEGEDDKPESKRGINKRFRELTQKNRRLEAENQQLKAGAKPEVAKPEASVAPKGKPALSDYEDYDKYVEDLADWKVEQKLAAKVEAEERTKAEAEFKTVVETFESRVQAFSETHTDYDDVIDSVEDIEFSNELRDVLLGHEKGPEVAYQLAKDRAEAERISKLPPKAQVFEIGQLVARLSTAAAPAPKPQPKASSAPEPIEPSSRPSATRAVRFDDPNVDYASFEKTMNRRQAGR